MSTTRSLRLVTLALTGAFLAGCGGAPSATPKSSVKAATSSSAPTGQPRAPLLPPERPLTPAEFVLLTEQPLFASELGTELFALGPGQAGFLTTKRRRAIATPGGVRTIDDTKLDEICVARDRKTTFAATVDKNYVVQIHRSDGFDGALVPLGKRLALRYANLPTERALVVSDERGTFLVECASGAISRMGEPATGAGQLSWNEAVTSFRLHRDDKSECVYRIDDRWFTLPACDVRSQVDGSLVFEALHPPPRAGAQRRCLKRFAADGKEMPCGAPIGRPIQTHSPPTPQAIPWHQGRYFAPRRIALPASDGSIIEFSNSWDADASRRISPPGLGQCTPLLPTAPLFRCVSESGAAVVASVDRGGAFREELRRAHAGGGGDTVHVTVDGGVALGGTCEGALEQAACVRRADGSFHTVRFSPELVTALTRTAPMTKLIPTREGELYVGIGALEGGLAGRISIKLFKADSGPGVAVENVPTWILGSLAGLGEMFMLGANAAWDVTEAFSLGFSRADSIRLWPFARLHPAFRTQEQCRIDLTLQGAFDVACEQGALYHVGRVGVLQQRENELSETLDAGDTWTKVPLPPGLEFNGVICASLGCRVGPYFRRGWGASPG